MSKKISCREAKERALAEALFGYESRVRRPAADWRPPKGLRDHGRLTLHAARHLYSRYPVPSHLETIWLWRAGLDFHEVEMRKRWYLAVAQGRSLYEEADWKLTRAQAHFFQSISEVNYFEGAICEAIALSFGAPTDHAKRIVTVVPCYDIRRNRVWISEVIRFFCRFPTTVEEMSDICRYLMFQHRENPAYSLAGRSLAAVSRQVQLWEREQQLIDCVAAIRRQLGDKQEWNGSPEKWRWKGESLLDWRQDGQADTHLVVQQLRSVGELIEEGRAMRHCVASYAADCIAGKLSIWALRKQVGAAEERVLTIELNSRRRVVQLRGFANRDATESERFVLASWARARNVQIRA